MQQQQHQVLVVDDDKEIVGAIEIYLAQAGLAVTVAYDGAEAIRLLAEKEFHIIVMDIMMPKLDGIQAMLKIREERNIPIILLSAKSEDTDKIFGLTMGADDYITKPFSPLELIARVKSQLRRYTTFGAAPVNSGAITTGALTMDTELKAVSVDGEEVKLTPIEYKMLLMLMQNLGRVFSIDEIYERVWNEPNINGHNTVAVHIRRIREKIEINPKEPRYLKVVWGIGYKIEKY
ncbi:response regulator transcription factor [Azotosporobacter soli]|uniref:response regulator transcription factor n=1 Tax=Azotosporobacter soli TaxID=3055040 RepID=UPI0031FEA17F